MLFAGCLVISLPVEAALQCTERALEAPATPEGVYVNLMTGITGETEASVPGFDINLYAPANADPPGQLKFYWGQSSIGGAGVASIADTYAVLAPGDTIGPASLFTRAAFAGNTSAWQAGTTGFLGLRFRNEASAVINYGWVQLATTPPFGFPATILRWCYEDSGAAITIPAPPDSLFADGFDPGT
ncbi:hypothetical protein [Tahibacter amnicola]|uniref:Uncharacterized protein n=1 Tax=Tahibacter amnicola TaxID=2976241 RepID=A0ABY6BNY1_9GAMM|nr:hypothetical protein [Tahibacter amnicola]UXI70105.1 hypothetical protein N4264_10890 [Tahibacter amnicola]